MESGAASGDEATRTILTAAASAPVFISAISVVPDGALAEDAEARFPAFQPCRVTTIVPERVVETEGAVEVCEVEATTDDRKPSVGSVGSVPENAATTKTAGAAGLTPKA